MFVQSKVRIAEELIRNLMVHAIVVIGLVIVVNGSLSISFDAIVYGKHKPSEAVVASYFNSRERPQSSAEVLKNVNYWKNLHETKNSVILRKMGRIDHSQRCDGGNSYNNAIHDARALMLRFTLKCAFDLRLFVQSKVRIAEELIRNLMVHAIVVIGLVIVVNGSLSIL